MTALDIENLPFLPGVSSIVQRVADLHALGTFAAPGNWKELLKAGERAVASVSRELALAKSSAEAATAGLRWKAYEEGLNAAHAALLRVAQRLLQSRPEFHSSTGLMIGLLGLGRDVVGGPMKIIPRSHWEAGAVDWTGRTLAVEGTRWHGVRILDLADIDIEIAIQLLEEPDDDVPVQSKGLHSPAEATRSGASEQAVETRSAPAKERPASQSGTNKRVSYTTMARFLVTYVDKFPVGDPNLSEAALWTACKHHFGGSAPNRKTLRDWIGNDMNPAKRKRRGDRSW